MANVQMAITIVLVAAVTIALYAWKRNMVLPLAGGTIVYMVLLHTLF